MFSTSLFLSFCSSICSILSSSKSCCGKYDSSQEQHIWRKWLLLVLSPDRYCGCDNRRRCGCFSSDCVSGTLISGFFGHLLHFFLGEREEEVSSEEVDEGVSSQCELYNMIYNNVFNNIKLHAEVILGKKFLCRG